MERAGCHLNVLLLDACRSAPSRMERGARCARSGLAEMRAPAGSVIAFACAPGKTAQDGSGRNGIFTSHLLRHITRPGVDVDIILRAVSAGVADETRKEQDPYHNHNLKTNNVCLIPALPGGAGAAAPGPAASSATTAHAFAAMAAPLPPPPPLAHLPSAPELAAFLARCDLQDDAHTLMGSLQALGVRKHSDLLLIDEEMLAALRAPPITAKKLRAGLAAEKAAEAKAAADRARVVQAAAEQAAAQKAAAVRAAAAAAAEKAAAAERAVKAAADQAAAVRAAAERAAAAEATQRAAAAKAAADRVAAERASAERAAMARAAVVKGLADKAIADKAAAEKAAHDGLSALYAARDRGDLASTVRYLRAHQGVETAQEAGCLALTSVLFANKLAGTPTDGSVEAALSALRAHPRSTVVLIAGCRAIINICTKGDAMTSKAQTLGGFDAVASAMRVCASDALLQQYGCWAMRNMTTGSAAVVSAGQPKACAAGAAETLVAALRAHQTQETLQEHGLGALSWMCMNNATCAAKVAAAGGCEAAVAALRALPSVRPVQRAASQLLRFVCKDSPAVKTRARAAGAVAALNEALARCGLFSDAKKDIVEALDRIR